MTDSDWNVKVKCSQVDSNPLSFVEARRLETPLVKGSVDVNDMRAALTVHCCRQSFESRGTRLDGQVRAARLWCTSHYCLFVERCALCGVCKYSVWMTFIVRCERVVLHSICIIRYESFSIPPPKVKVTRHNMHIDESTANTVPSIPSTRAMKNGCPKTLDGQEPGRHPLQ